MKRYLLPFSLLLALCLGLAACGSDSPESVAENYLEAVGHGDLDKAKNLACKKMAPMVEAQVALVRGLDAVVELDADYTLVKEKNDMAVVRAKGEKTVSVKGMDDQNEPFAMQLSLVKEDGEWKVCL